MNFYSWHYGLDGGAVSLEQHDKRFHPNGYNAEASCEFRDQHPELVQQQRRSDNADDLTNSSSAVTPEEDKAYADAVANGDRDAALRMVRSVAAKAMPNTKVVDSNGNPMVVYHGSYAQFTQFNTGKYEVGMFFTDNKEIARLYGGGANVYSVYLMSSNPCKMNWYGDIDNDYGDNHGPIIEEAEGAKEDGYDGFIAFDTKDDNDSDTLINQYVVFNPSQIKSAKITYDDNGNLIPLSKRFNFSNPDIRY